MVDLRPDQLATVRAILQAEVPECEVWAFGSRAKWTAKDSSDLDLALVASARLPSSKLGRLREAFTDSYLPIKVDVVDIHRVSDEFRKIIESQKVVLQKPTSAESAQTARGKWQTLPLDECLETLIDYRGKTPKKVSSGIPLITAKVVKNGRIETPDEFIAEEDYEGWMRRGFPQAGDVLLTMEAPLGEVAQLDDRKVALAQRLVALRGKQGLLDNWFLKYLLQSSSVQDQLRSRATGTTVLGIKQSELRKINLTLPPLPEQRAIASVLGALDDKIELNRRMNETLEALAQSLFKSWFVDATQSALPKGWKLTRLKDLTTKIGSGATPRGGSAVYVEEGVALIRSQNVYDHEFHWDGLARLTDEAAKELQGVEVKPEDILLNITGDSILRTCVVESEVLPARVNQHVAIIRAKPGVPPRFLHLFLVQQRTKHFLAGLDAGATRRAITKGQLEAVEVLHPPDELLAKFADLTNPIFRRINSNRSESRTLAALRDALLPKLLSGELRVPAAAPLVEATA